MQDSPPASQCEPGAERLPAWLVAPTLLAVVFAVAGGPVHGLDGADRDLAVALALMPACAFIARSMWRTGRVRLQHGLVLERERNSPLFWLTFVVVAVIALAPAIMIGGRLI